jgi:hypothetical protein
MRGRRRRQRQAAVQKPLHACMLALMKDRKYERKTGDCTDEKFEVVPARNSLCLDMEFVCGEDVRDH